MYSKSEHLISHPLVGTFKFSEEEYADLENAGLCQLITEDKINDIDLNQLLNNILEVKNSKAKEALLSGEGTFLELVKFQIEEIVEKIDSDKKNEVLNSYFETPFTSAISYLEKIGFNEQRQLNKLFREFDERDFVLEVTSAFATLVSKPNETLMQKMEILNAYWTRVLNLPAQTLESRKNMTHEQYTKKCNSINAGMFKENPTVEEFNHFQAQNDLVISFYNSCRNYLQFSYEEEKRLEAESEDSNSFGL